MIRLRFQNKNVTAYKREEVIYFSQLSEEKYYQNIFIIYVIDLSTKNKM